MTVKSAKISISYELSTYLFDININSLLLVPEMVKFEIFKIRRSWIEKYDARDGNRWSSLLLEDITSYKSSAFELLAYQVHF